MLAINLLILSNIINTSISSNAINAVTVTNDGQGYQSIPTVSLASGNTTIAGVGVLTAALVSAEQLAVTHAGWVVRTAGTGGRSGRVQYETLVETSSAIFSGDQPFSAYSANY